MTRVTPKPQEQMSVAEYHKLIACGAIEERCRVELLRGRLVEKPRRTPLVAFVIGMLPTLLTPLLPNGFHSRSQSPITLEDSEPEPDLAILRGDVRDYFTRHPGSTETLLVVEVFTGSLATDLVKAETYAEAGIPWYWIVNLTARRVEVYSQLSPTPAGLRYGPPHCYQPREMIPVIIDGSEIGTVPAAELLPEITTP